MVHAGFGYSIQQRTEHLLNLYATTINIVPAGYGY